MPFSLRSKPPLADAAGYLEAAPASGPLAVGAMLRRQREALGLDIADVAAALRIKPAYLMALEAERPDTLPGAVYAIGFMRAYAEHLGLDGGEVLRRFKRESAVLAAKPDLAFPIPLGERSMPGGGMLLVASILAICAYGGWFYLSTGEGPRPERVAAVPLELLPNPSRPVEAMAAPQPSAASTDLRGLSSPTEPGSGSTGFPAAANMAAVPEPAPAPTTPPGSEAAREVIIRATADSWVQIRDSRQSVLLARVLKRGEICRVPGQSGLSLRTGNAGGLEITVDGTPVPSIGRTGMVRRNVALDGRALLAGKAARN